jgi:hypothetical protein
MMRQKIRLSGVLLLVALGASGCGVRLGVYKAPAYEPYRPRGTSESVAIHVERTPPLQRVPIVATGRMAQGLPVILELPADDTLTWAALANRFTIYEVQGNRSGRMELVDTFPVYPVTRLEERDERAWTRTDSLSNHPGVNAGNRDLIASTGAATLRRMTELSRDIGGASPRLRGPQTLMLVCLGTEEKPACLRQGRLYELHIRAPVAAVSPETAAVRAANPAIIYPFRIENRSIPVTVLTGVAMLLGFLQWATG